MSSTKKHRAKAKDEKHLRLRHNKWGLHYVLPKELRNNPLFDDLPDTLVKALGTDSLTIAKQKRDRIINDLYRRLDGDAEEAFLKLIALKNEQMLESNNYDHLAFTYSQLYQDAIIEKAIVQYGIDQETGHPAYISKEDIKLLSLLQGKKPDTSKLLSVLTKKVIKELEASQHLAPKTISKIKGGVTWFLNNLLQDDIDITLIDYDQVHELITLEQTKGVSGNTLNGYMYGLSEVWKRAAKSKLVRGSNPFSNHKIPKNPTHYSPFTLAEVLAMYEATDDAELKLLIHAGYTTGARLNELITASIKIPSTFDKPCWLFKFEGKGKTPQSTRVVPLHSSLTLSEGFTFKISDRTASRKFSQLVATVITARNDECTGKPRKLSFHSLRTTLVTTLVGKEGISEAIVGGITGHLAGSSKLGSIISYINTDDLNTKQQTVERLKWKE